MTAATGGSPPWPQAAVDPLVEDVRRAVATALAEDFGPQGDLTAALVPDDVRAVATVVARRPGVVAGRLCALETLRAVDPRLETTWLVDDGGHVESGTVVAEIRGPLRSLLGAERTLLNFLCHLSGVASLTRLFVEAAHAANAATHILDTRKTTPGLRALEKAAVRAGGGHNHRASLSDAVLVKDNHLAVVDIAEAVERARRLWPGRTVEVECDRLEQLRAAVDAGAEVVMLDNMTPDQVAACVADVRARPGCSVLIEVSGGVSLDTVAAYAAAGADLVSVGALTHSAPVLDLGLDMKGS